jgi:mono/diheme cytochrome c family protein
MKRSFFYLIIAGVGIFTGQCGSNSQPAKENARSTDTLIKKANTDTVIVFLGNNSKGVGRFRDVTLNHPLNENMAAKGQIIYQSKCIACHKLTAELLVGPGWEGVTNRRTPEWIMNWITNTKIMLDKDLAAQADMAICLIRMPNQDLTDQQARDVFEFMLKNDGRK